METDLLTRRQHVPIGRRSLGLLLIALLLSLAAATGMALAQTLVSSVDVHALRNDPWPVAVSAARSGDDFVVRATARFPNDCVAQAGFDAIYRDLAPLRLTGTRLLLLRGRRPPQGCPDIDAPVNLPFQLQMPGAATVQQVVLLDEVAGQQPTIVRASAGNFVAGGDAIRAAGMLLPLAAAALRPGPELRLRIALPQGCTPRDVTIEMVEGRSVTASGEALAPIPLWVLVLADVPACQSDSATDQTVELVTSLRSMVLQGRELWLVNPLFSTGSPPGLFTRLGR